MFFVSSKMNAAYIGIVVIVSLMQISIGRCEASQNSTDCSKTGCGENEQCHGLRGRVFYCLCKLHAYRQVDTLKCILKYQWVSFKPQLWNSKKLVPIDDPDHSILPYVVARPIYYNGDSIPIEGLILVSDKTIGSNSLLSENYTDIQVLLIESGRAKWIPSSNGIVELNAIEGGKIGEEIVYVCRVKDGSYYYGGMMQPSRRSCYIKLHYGDHSNYELLIYEYRSDVVYL